MTRSKTLVLFHALSLLISFILDLSIFVFSASKAGNGYAVANILGALSMLIAFILLMIQIYLARGVFVEKTIYTPSRVVLSIQSFSKFINVIAWTAVSTDMWSSFSICRAQAKVLCNDGIVMIVLSITAIFVDSFIMVVTLWTWDQMSSHHTVFEIIQYPPQISSLDEKRQHMSCQGFHFY